MKDLLADTHSLIWYLFDSKRLSPAALQALTAANLFGRIYISAITLVELNYIAGKKNFPYPGILPLVIAQLTDPHKPFEVLPVTFQIALAMDRVPRNEVPDMPDRIIAATAVEHRLPLVSADSNIRRSTSLNAITPVIW